MEHIQINQIKALLKEVGAYLKTENQSFNREAIEIKGMHDLVSYVDKTSERLLIEGLKKITPDASFLAEESGIETGISSDLQWIIDPLDGTTNFIHRVPFYCISIALYKNQQPWMGFVFEANHENLFWAVKNQGAFLNDQRLGVSTQQTLEHALIGTGFPVNKFQHLTAYMKLTEAMIRNSRGLRRLGTAAFDLCCVATGMFDGFYEIGLQPWDVAAGALIVEEAGGKVSDFNGGKNAIFGEQILATNGHIHSQIQKHIQNAFE